MNLTDDIHYYADPDAICIWWEKPDGADKIEKYELRLDGLLSGETTKTDFTFEDLESEREYLVQVSAMSAEGLLLDDVSLHIQTPPAGKSIIVTDEPYCAKGDSITKNTKALQRAIDDCPEGGSVVVPEGTYLTGALFLHSRMELYICEGAVLLGSADDADYLPLIRQRVNGTESEDCAGLLNIGSLDHREGPLCHNVTVRGKGTVKGSIYINNCSNVRISSLTLANAPVFGVHITYSLNILTDHCIFRSGTDGEGHGWVPDSSENCTLFACTFFTGGDSVSVRSGRNPEGIRIARPSRKIRIFDCKSMFGQGISIGSDMSGGVENVRIWDCDLERTTWGIQVIFAKNRGGYVRGLWVEDCVTSRLRALPVDDDETSAKDDIPDIENLLYERVLIKGRSLKNGAWRECFSVEMKGFDKDHPLSNILLRDIDIQGGLGVCTEFCEGLIFEDSKGEEG